MDQHKAETPDPNSRLNKVYRYLWTAPYTTIIPDEYMPLDAQVHYIFEQVKHLRDGTDFPELTLEELQDIMYDEFPKWREEKEELPDWFLKKHGMEKPKMENN